tara:strand:+ start:1195 stop:1440 length:246 start_codon:yes stop_codon:yes gene_type:complete
MGANNKMSAGKLRRIKNKEDAIRRKEEKIEAMEETLKTESKMTGKGWNPVKDYHAGTYEKIIKRKKDAIERKKRKIKNLKS